MSSMPRPDPPLPTPESAAVTALAPGGVLRAGINLSNFLLVSDRGPEDEPVGVSPSIARVLAEQLGMPLELISFPNPGELADAVTADRWDIGNIGADPARAEHIAFTAPYAEIEATYLVRGNSHIASIADVDRAGTTVVSKARAAYTLWLDRNLQQATLIHTKTTDESLDRFIADGIDVLAGLRPRLMSDQAQVDGSRILDGRFTAVQQAVGTPRDRNPVGIAYLESFVAAILDSGFVAELINHHGVTGLLPASR